MHKAMDVALDADLREFIGFLQSQGIAVRVTEEANHQAIWVSNPEQAEWVRTAWQSYRQGEWAHREWFTQPALEVSARPAIPVQRCPVTFVVLGISLLVFIMSGVLQDVRWLSALSFEPLQLSPDGRSVSFLGFDAGWQAREYWRALTPVFLHFGILHIVFNGLWWWELGRRIEVRAGSVSLALLFLCSGVFSNACQYLVSHWVGDPSLFGGLSGVIYALIGYIGVWNVLKPAVRYDVPRGLIAIMLGFLVVCMTGVMEWVGLGRIANTAHVAGLVAGSVWGLGAVLLSGRQHGH